MNMGLTLALVLGALGGAAAQDLGAYNRLAASLDEAARVRAASAPQALGQLDRAQEALTALSPTLRNRQIVTGLEDALSGARAALARTPAELQAQVALARGLMRKALYDQTLAGLVAGQWNGSQVQLLAREFGLQGSAAQALIKEAQSGQLERVSWRLQNAAVTKVNSALAATRPRQEAASYLNLARATGWFTVVQDAGGVGQLTVTRFGDALRQLTAGDTAALSTSLKALRTDMKAFTATLRRPAAGSATSPVPAPKSVPAPAATGGAATGNAGGTDEVQLTPAPAPASTVTQAAGGGLGGLYAALGRALSEAGHADGASARAQLTEARKAVESLPPDLRGADGYDVLVAGLDRAASRRALRPPEVQALLGQVTALEDAAAGRPVSALDRLSGNAASFGGWVRALLFALLGAAAFVPLYLLNLAFGGRNTSWRFVMAGLALLLTPVILEGLFGLLGALGDALNLGALRGLTNFTLFQGAYGLPLWWLLSAGAVGLLALGFRGLCEQFGLLGQSRGTPAPSDPASLDWDEEI